MTVDEVKGRVQEIREIARDDDEVAHSREDALYIDVLRAIASGRVENPVVLATVALDAAGIEFARWCA